MHYYRNRYYLAGLGIFMSRDAAWADQARGWGYVGNCPAAVADAYGRSPDASDEETVMIVSLGPDLALWAWHTTHSILDWATNKILSKSHDPRVQRPVEGFCAVLTAGPLDAANALLVGREIDKFCKDTWGEANPKTNAIRHCWWMCDLHSSSPDNCSDWEDIGASHEVGQDVIGNEEDMMRDAWNNQVGKTLAKPGRSHCSCLQECLRAFDSGLLATEDNARALGVY